MTATHFDYSGDHEAMKAEIARFNPDDVAGYERFLEASAELYDVGFDQLLTVSFDSLWKMLRSCRSCSSAQFYRSVYGLVARYIKHPKLRMVFSFHPLLVGGNPFTTTAVYALIAQLERRHGVHFAMGGTGSLVNGLVRLIEEQGGELRYDAHGRADRGDEGRRAAGVRAGGGEELQRRHRGVQRRLGGDLPPSRAGKAAQALDQSQARARALLDEPVRLVLRHRPAV